MNHILNDVKILIKELCDVNYDYKTVWYILCKKLESNYENHS